jgi:hypothetical protein
LLHNFSHFAIQAVSGRLTNAKDIVLILFLFFKLICSYLDEKRKILDADSDSLSASVIPMIREISFLSYSCERTSKRLWKQLESIVLTGFSGPPRTLSAGAGPARLGGETPRGANTAL